MKNYVGKHYPFFIDSVIIDPDKIVSFFAGQIFKPPFF
jgi:hypothetical protein